MLSIENIFNLAGSHPISVTSHYDACTQTSNAPPKPSRMSVRFHADDPEVWSLRMTELTEVPVSMFGTRKVTGNGATEDLFKPAYSALLGEVNAKRAGLGLATVYR